MKVVSFNWNEVWWRLKSVLVVFDKQELNPDYTIMSVK